MTAEPENYGLIKGFVLVWGFNLIHLGANVFLSITPIGKFSLKYFAICQLVYVIPVALDARKHGLTDRLKGIIIAASITFLLGSMCFFTGW